MRNEIHQTIHKITLFQLFFSESGHVCPSFKLQVNIFKTIKKPVNAVF